MSELSKEVRDVIDQCHMEIHATLQAAKACAVAVAQSQAERRAMAVIDPQSITIPQNKRPYLEVVSEPKRKRRAAP